MTASGTAGHGAELAPYVDLGVARRGRREVAVRRAVGRQPAAAGARDRRRDAQQRRPAGPRRRGVAGATTSRRSLATGARVVASIWGRTVAEYEAAAAAAGRRAARGRRRRGQPVVPEHRGRPATCSPTRPRPPHDAMAATAALRPPALGQAQPQRHRPRADRRGRARRPAPRRSRWSTPCSAWPSTPRPGATGSARARGAAGCPARPSTRSPCGPSTTCTPPCPTCPIVGVGGVDHRRRRRRAAPRRRRPRCRSARPPSPIPGRPAACSDELDGVGRSHRPHARSVPTWAPPTEGRPPHDRRPLRRRRSARRLAVALDVDDSVAALRLARELQPWFGVAKVGLELFSASGPDVVGALIDLGYEVFFDLKLHDIPTTVGPGRPRARRARRHATSPSTRRAGAPCSRPASTGSSRAPPSAGLAGADRRWPSPCSRATTTRPPHILPKRVQAALEAGCGGHRLRGRRRARGQAVRTPAHRGRARHPPGRHAPRTTRPAPPPRRRRSPPAPTCS